MDKLIITILGGKGGNGTLGKIIRNKKVFLQGGDGGKGGDIYIQSDKNIHSFHHLRSKKIYKAANGFNGKKNGGAGKKGKDIILKVPVYTKIYCLNTNIKIFEFLIHNQKKLFAKGGVEGKGGKHFQGIKNQMNNGIGKHGEIKRILLKFFIKNDIVIIGPHFSGKTTFLNNINNILFNNLLLAFQNIFIFKKYKNIFLNEKFYSLKIIEMSNLINKYLFLKKEYLLNKIYQPKILIIIIDINETNFFLYNLSYFLHNIYKTINPTKLIIVFNKINLLLNIHYIKKIITYIKTHIIIKSHYFFLNINNMLHNIFFIKQINKFNF